MEPMNHLDSETCRSTSCLDDASDDTRVDLRAAVAMHFAAVLGRECEGWFLVFAGKEIVGIWPTREEAMKACQAHRIADLELFELRTIPKAVVVDKPIKAAGDRTVHFSKLGPLLPASRHAREWEVFRNEIGRLITEGHEGEYVLISGDDVVGFWPTFEEARSQGILHGDDDPFVFQIATEIPMLRSGYSKLCPS